MDMAKFACAQACTVLLLTLPTGLGPPTIQPLDPPLVVMPYFPAVKCMHLHPHRKKIYAE